VTHESPVEYCLFWAQSLCLPSSEWAAWTQGIGTVAAIFATIQLVRWQVDRARREQREEAQRRLQTIWLFVYHTRADLTAAAEVLQHDADVPFHLPDVVIHRIDALRRIPVLNLVNPPAAAAVLSAIETRDALVRGLEEVRQRRGWVENYEVVPWTNYALDNFADAERRLRRELIDAGADAPPGNYLVNQQPYPPLEAYSR
jgi:predicted metal-dependent hydrolase